MKFKYRENAYRKEKYAKPDDVEKFLDLMNETLREIEPKLRTVQKKPLPLLFVMGVMRSGTTLLTQILSSCLNIAIINNLVARFWLAPVTGIRLSKALFGDKRKISFDSDFGKTADLSEPHEFSYFWHHWLKMEEIPPYYPDSVQDKIDWDGLKLTLRNMAAEFDRPLLMKASDVGYHIEKFQKVFPEAIFILIRRDLADIALSLQKGRVQYYGDKNIWLGSYPVEYEEIKDLKGMDQIAAQVFYLDQMFESGIKRIPSSRVVSTTYEEVCKNPNEIVDTVEKRISDATGFTIRKSSAVMEPFSLSSYSSTEEYKKYKVLLDRMERKKNESINSSA